MSTIPDVEKNLYVVTRTETLGTVEATSDEIAGAEALGLAGDNRDGLYVRPVHLAGTNPSPTEDHEPRVTVDPRSHMSGLVSEIEDGVLVAWDTCAGCRKHVLFGCKCANGPTEPKYITAWRQARFQKSLDARLRPKDPWDDSVSDTRPNPPAVETPVAEKVDQGLDKALAAVTQAAGDSEEEPTDVNTQS